jgi:AcrR family transcriptional regulator
MNKLSRKEREFLRHRGEILDVALELFSRRGFHNVTMHEIARESEFSVGTLYKFFENKEDLYKALFLEKAEEFSLVMQEAIEKSEDEMSAIRTFIDQHIKLFMKNLRFVQLYLAETRGARFNIGMGMEKEIRQKHRVFLTKLSAVFKKGIEKGIFEDIDPYLLAIGLEGVIHAFLFNYLEDPCNHPFDADVIMRLFFGKVLRNAG